MGAMKARAHSYFGFDDEIQNDYLNWLIEFVDGIGGDVEYSFLLRTLHRREFYSVNPMDVNREEDGKKLRKMFADQSLWRDYSSLEGPCSVLELLIGLAIRMEEIVYDPDEGDRTVIWFWEMINHLGLEDCTDERWLDESGMLITTYVRESIDRFIERDYRRNGTRGGLFPLRLSKHDQKHSELWYQMQAYIRENF